LLKDWRGLNFEKRDQQWICLYEKPNEEKKCKKFICSTDFLLLLWWGGKIKSGGFLNQIIYCKWFSIFGNDVKAKFYFTNFSLSTCCTIHSMRILTSYEKQFYLFRNFQFDNNHHSQIVSMKHLSTSLTTEMSKHGIRSSWRRNFYFKFSSFKNGFIHFMESTKGESHLLKKICFEFCF